MKQNEHEKLTIRVNGKYVEVEDMNGITATAKCNPVDKFDIHVGIGIALQRLENEQIKQQKKEATTLTAVASFLIYILVRVYQINTVI